MTAFFRSTAWALAIVAIAIPVYAQQRTLRTTLGRISTAQFQGRHITPPAPPPRLIRVDPAARFAALAAGWQSVRASPPFASAGHTMLMTNGEVLIQRPNSPYWYGLVPDATGSYVNGSWKQQATMPAGYAPLYYASAILPDGRMVVSGGEYNGSNTLVWTNQSAIYDITRNAWTSIAPPAGWSSIGDAPSVVTPNGTFVVGNCCSTQAAYLNPTTLKWTATGADKSGSNNEEGWTLLPSGLVLTADIATEPGSETLNPATGTWSSAGTLPVNVTYEGEIGPQILRQNGHVLVIGADGLTAIYNPSAGNHWTQGPTLPTYNGRQLEIDDGPAALLPDGDVVMVASPAGGGPPAIFLDFSASGSSLTAIAGPPNAASDVAYYYNLLVLPTGQILASDFSNDVEIFTPGGTPNAAIAPTIDSAPASVTPGSTYTIAGVGFNGVSQTNAYGDDAQQATNYPLVQIINAASHRVTYARTHAFSSMAVASPAKVSAQFDVPPTTPTGKSSLVVIANGIASHAITITVK